ncbi:MAG TPA: hypothetical protein PLW65_11730 [Pseudomonadota bacterium]|nr:hypothetical protein [Pseudomonadota bacterium]
MGVEAGAEAGGEAGGEAEAGGGVGRARAAAVRAELRAAGTRRMLAMEIARIDLVDLYTLLCCPIDDNNVNVDTVTI